jgi:NAD(P)-dependent dehydrogenase (short-subunit alcohol dehydrogenase family)
MAKEAQRVVVVTGASSGIGKATAIALAQQGWRVIGVGRSPDRSAAAEAEIRAASSSGQVDMVRADLSRMAEAKRAASEIAALTDRIDVLVNNAGYSLLGNFEEMTTPDIVRQFATNFWGVAYVMRAALPVMRRQRSGHIVNISSVAGVTGQKHCGAYGATKFAVEGLSLAVAQEVGQFGIMVTVVEPGFFRTDLLDARNIKYADSTIADYAAEGSAEAMWSAYDGTQPGDPARLGDAIVELIGMATPPQVFVAGSDALAAVTPVLEARLKDIRAHAMLSRSTDSVSQK